MKQGQKNEIDVLLKRLARDTESVPASDALLSQHLDADELNAFAEDALPSAARSRYTKHLIECMQCRGLVTNLAVATGRSIADERAKPHGSSFRTLMNALFSTATLRYAAPVFATLIILAIGFFVLRQQRGFDYIAQNPSPEHLATAPQRQTNESQQESQATSSDVNVSTRTPPTKAERATGQGKASTQTGDRNEADSIVTVQKERTESPAEVEQPSFAPDPKPAAPAAPPPPPVVSEVQGSRPQTVAEERQQQAAKEGEDARKRDSAARPGSGEQNKPAGQSLRRLPLAGPTSVGSAKNEAPAKDKKQTESAAEVRSVAGRQFRRDTGAWVDTGYVEGRRTIVVHRGSEQYRALLADEPGIKQIAEKFDGVVIILWKGRAYKIQ